MKQMRILSLLLMILFSKSLIAQPKNSVYLYETSAETGHVLLVEYPQTKISLHVYRVGPDSDGTHKDEIETRFTFTLKGTITNRVIKLTTDKPVDYCELKCPKGISHFTAGANPAKTQYTFFINQMKADEFSFVVYNKEKVFVKIQEISKYIR